MVEKAFLPRCIREVREYAILRKIKTLPDYSALKLEPHYWNWSPLLKPVVPLPEKGCSTLEIMKLEKNTLP